MLNKCHGWHALTMHTPRTRRTIRMPRGACRARCFKCFHRNVSRDLITLVRLALPVPAPGAPTPLTLMDTPSCCQVLDNVSSELTVSPKPGRDTLRLQTQVEYTIFMLPDARFHNGMCSATFWCSSTHCNISHAGVMNPGNTAAS